MSRLSILRLAKSKVGTAFGGNALFCAITKGFVLHINISWRINKDAVHNKNLDSHTNDRPV